MLRKSYEETIMTPEEEKDAWQEWQNEMWYEQQKVMDMMDIPGAYK